MEANWPMECLDQMDNEIESMGLDNLHESWHNNGTWGHDLALPWWNQENHEWNVNEMKLGSNGPLEHECELNAYLGSIL